MSKAKSPDNTKRAWDRLIEASLAGKPRSFNVDLELTIEGETWTAYGAEVAHRDILFFCKEGTVTYLVDSYGDRNTIELFNWERGE